MVLIRSIKEKKLSLTQAWYVKGQEKERLCLWAVGLFIEAVCFGLL